MPDGSEAGCAAAGAVIVSLEDGVADTIRPRLEAAGAVLEKVRIVATIKGADGIERTPTIPDDLPAIEAAIRDVNAKFLVLDPLVATLDAETNSYRDQDIRRALAPVAALADRTGAAVNGIRHLTKGSGQNPKYRGGGSIGIIGAARAAFLFADAPGEEGVHVMAPVKGNLWRRKPDALEYTIEEKDGQPVIAWRGKSNHSAQSLLAQPESSEESNALADAKNFVREFLKDGPHNAKEVKQEARRAGVSNRTLYRAKAAMGIMSRKSGIGDGQHWQWELAKSAAEPVKIANTQSLATFEQVSEPKPVTSTFSPKAAKSASLAGFEPGDGNLRTEDESEVRL
jgi:gas vesicle protein